MQSTNYYQLTTKLGRVWLIPLLVSLAIFIAVHPTFAQLSDKKARLYEQIINEGRVETGIETVDGFSHSYYVFEDEKVFLTEGSQNDKQIFANGEYIVWVKEYGNESKINIYNILSGTTLELPKTGANLNPKVSKQGKVVWESWVNDDNSLAKGNWQLFVYDGSVIRQITEGDYAGNASIEGDFVVYARKNAEGLWSSFAYSIDEDKHASIDIGNETEYPRLEEGNIFIGPPKENQKKFPLQVRDLFLVDNSSEFEDVGITLTDIEKELSLMKDEELQASGSSTLAEEPEP